MATTAPHVPTNELPHVPAKRYFTIGEVAVLCGVKPHVLRYWEQEFVLLSPVKRRGNRRYYQRQEVQLVRRIRELLYDQGFTIAGARSKLDQMSNSVQSLMGELNGKDTPPLTLDGLRDELLNIAALMTPTSLAGLQGRTG
jgi:DNA-binding transcriptional MerR regulator